MMYRPHLLPKVRSQAIMASAQGAPCTTRISSLFPGHRCSDDATCVCAHVDGVGKGIGTKTTDIVVRYACSNCHAILDGADNNKLTYITEKYPLLLANRLVESVKETLTLLYLKEIIVIPDGELIGERQMHGGLV